MSIQPEGEDLRKAVRWISEQRQSESNKTTQQLADEACILFDLSPKEAAFLSKLIKEEKA